jgi:predicted acyl esterase
MQVKTVQHGFDSGKKNPNTGEPVCGPEILSDSELLKNREDMWQAFLSRETWDGYYAERSPDLSRVTMPLLSAANWGGQGLHTRGNFEGFVRSNSKDKWLEVHGGSHWAPFYTDYGIDLQKRFFDFFLKGKQNGWDRQPRVLLNVRHPGEMFVQRHENEWPLARTQWTKFFLHKDLSLSEKESDGEGTVSYDPMGSGLTFSMVAKRPTEITGPSALKLRISSATNDADLFVVLRVFDPAGKEALFQGALDPKTPVAQGWLRASHRKLDPRKSLPYRPWHTHDEIQKLVPGKSEELDIEIWPTCIVVPAGWTIALSIRGRDYEHDDAAATLSNMKHPMKGCGPFTHDDPTDRPPAVFGGKVTLHLDRKPYLLLPIIPEK